MSAGRVLAAVGALVVAAALAGVVLVAGAVGLVTGAPAAVPAAGSPPVGDASGAGVPPAMAALYREAAATCPGLPAAVLAAIGTVESGNGTSDLPGVHAGANAAGAEGPMQFLPSTFAAYDRPVPPGGADPPSPYDAVDAVYAAARMLCADGAAGGVDVPAAVYAYNHSLRYVAVVVGLAAQLEQGDALAP